MKLIIGLFTVLLAIVIVANLSKDYFKNHTLPFAKGPTITVNQQIFNLYEAKTEKDMETGLSNRSSMPDNYGMIFIFKKPGIYGFWMRKMKFGIDIIYINKNKVVQVFSDLLPPSPGSNLTIYKPREAADTVLEINAGLAKKYNIKKGDSVKAENL